MKTPTDVLRDEHVVILRALTALEAAAARLQGGGRLPAGWWEALLDWLRSFADRTHHAKEENSLFPAMIKAGAPSEGGPIDVMLDEHEQGRALIQAMAASAEPAVRAARAREYAHLLRAHIDKENGILFPLADAIIGERAMQDVARDFAVVEVEQGAAASIAQAEAALDRLSASLGE